MKAFFQNSDFELKMDFIVDSLETDLIGWGQLWTSSDLFGGKVLDICSELVGYKKTKWDKSRRN